MFTIRKKKRFEMAHCLASSYSKECQQVHGHSYIMEVIISSELLNQDGMVIDFKRLGEIINPIVNDFDHKLVKMGPEQLFGENEIILPLNPTAENMAKWILDSIIILLRDEIPSLKKLTVRLHETESGWAEFCEEL